MPAAKTKKRPFTKLRCDQCGKLNYFTKKSKAMAEEKMEFKKFCNACRARTTHKEARK